MGHKRATNRPKKRPPKIGRVDELAKLRKNGQTMELVGQKLIVYSKTTIVFNRHDNPDKVQGVGKN